MKTPAEFADRNFKIECSQITLRQGGQGSLVIGGPGELWQDDDGHIQFKIFVSEEHYEALNTHRNGTKRVLGQLVKEEDCFTLVAQTFSGPVWTSESVFPNRRGGLASGIAYGTIHELLYECSVPVESKAVSATIRLPDKISFPCNQGTETVTKRGDKEAGNSWNLNSAEYIHEKFMFRIHPEGDHTVAQISMKEGPDALVMARRLHESLQFVLGLELDLLVIETIGDGKMTTMLRSASNSKIKGSIPPPLRFQKIDPQSQFWMMFASYFCAVITATSSEPHPISQHLGSVIESTVASLGAEVLALTVAVEGLAGLTTSAQVSNTVAISEELNAVKKALVGVSLSDSTRARVIGALDAMTKIRNSDLLRIFLAEQQLPPALYKSWSRLRNAAAHGGGLGGREIEDVIRLRDEVRMLLYSLVLHLIGYSGLRTDYSQQGWPDCHWPIAASVPASPVDAPPVDEGVAEPPEISPSHARGVDNKPNSNDAVEEKVVLPEIESAAVSNQEIKTNIAIESKPLNSTHDGVCETASPTASE
ncbi:hypothetical protein [Prosthecobacter vanneervenii]|uniref:ApeA N-terminal domain-containing protein n=1 Tax=Prosthecobacter vanneervenii TaxID=48466 RepID=A0A7W8DKD6_9BACT|nr:hypothetical protein [Prosthecobacter vanneervenii]MBB5033124.1 hypothetical protein [Prosthecobacter vanneervenii]